MLLLARLGVGGMFLTHGIYKFKHFGELSGNFPHILGMGSRTGLCLAIFAELFCTLGFMAGFLYRLAMIPMIFTMAMAVFVAHARNPFAARELAALYLLVFIVMYCAGPGSLAIDYFLR